MTFNLPVRRTACIKYCPLFLDLQFDKNENQGPGDSRDDFQRNVIVGENWD